ncbi:hypothetical protein PsYK624_173330 [Phanerochaete sordida]|uniref:C2H2-type domain-containing protein n=1 Tax=Phanerochaete sordida TaxID=48140 RepID=A0A9P3GU60_9APHY|nr:hypothetical protein PsYK624_173330 [Phanerochaete sordida]
MPARYLYHCTGDDCDETFNHIQGYRKHIKKCPKFQNEADDAYDECVQEQLAAEAQAAESPAATPSVAHASPSPAPPPANAIPAEVDNLDAPGAPRKSRRDRHTPPRWKDFTKLIFTRRAKPKEDVLPSNDAGIPIPSDSEPQSPSTPSPSDEPLA